MRLRLPFLTVLALSLVAGCGDDPTEASSEGGGGQQAGASGSTGTLRRCGRVDVGDDEI